VTPDQFRRARCEGPPSAQVMRAVRRLRLVVVELTRGAPVDDLERELLRLAALELVAATREAAAAVSATCGPA
jgi:hypothetical protein